jgi:hypothetical protein
MQGGPYSRRIESVIDDIEQKVREVVPYVNPSKIYVEVEKLGRP